MESKHLSKRFKDFAETECKGSSPLYEYLSLKISDDDDILELCSYAQIGQPVPNLLLGAVHYLLQKGHDHPLRNYFSDLSNPPYKIVNVLFDSFKDFCRLYRGDIIRILGTKIVQTNEVRRCDYLFPVFSFIYNKVKKPLSLIEIGTSAGLQLLWDQFSYSYGTGMVYGNQESCVHITSKIKGERRPKLPIDMPPVSTRVGLDLHINDLRDADDYSWLKSLIWPEHKERLKLFEDAAKCFLENPIDLIEGDGVKLLTEVVEDLPGDTAICIFHTHVANQMPEELKKELLDKVKQIGGKRDVFHIYNNVWDWQLHLDYFIEGENYSLTIGETDGHGRWFEWYI